MLGKLAVGHPLPLYAPSGRSWLHPSSQGQYVGALRKGRNVVWPGEFALQKKFIQCLPQAQIHIKESSKPSSPASQSWQVHLLEGCMQEQHRLLQEILGEAQAVDCALLLTGFVSGDTH